MKVKEYKTKRSYFAYGSIIEALSFGLYPDKRHVLREFIQNAFDALNDLRSVDKSLNTHPIEVSIRAPSIFIADKGIGMDEKAVEEYRYLGYSKKERTKTVGFRGIGKDSGLAIAEKIIVTTSKLDVPKQYMIVIDASEMLKKIASTNNHPLDELLEEYSTVTSSSEDKDEHYTLVELYGIRKDAGVLFDIDNVKDYIKRNCPVPFDPEFTYASEVDSNLKSNIPDYSSIEILVNGDKLYKPFPHDYNRPEYERIFISEEDGSPLVAFCWYCSHTEKGQFEDKANSGLIYRVKNFAVGDRSLTRETLWHTTPERAFYFFGEIHILDSEVIPSTDRTDFEDNDARKRLYRNCRRIAQVLSQQAGVETDLRRFEEKTELTYSLISEKKQLLKDKKLSDILKPDIQYQVRQSIEDLEKRLKRAKGRSKHTKRDISLSKTAERIVKQGNKFLQKITTGNYFYELTDVIKINKQAIVVYKIIIDCLKEEFKTSPETLESLITKIDQELKKSFTKISHD